MEKEEKLRKKLDTFLVKKKQMSLDGLDQFIDLCGDELIKDMKVNISKEQLKKVFRNWIEKGMIFDYEKKIFYRDINFLSDKMKKYGKKT